MHRLRIYTTGRDYRPGFFWGHVLPPNTVYVRLLLAAHDVDQAEQLLLDRGASMYVETLTEAVPLDSPADAVRHLVEHHPDPAPRVYAVVRADEDVLGRAHTRPRISLWEIAADGPRELGRIRIVGMGRPTDPEPVTRVVPDDGEDDAVAIPEGREGPVPADNPVSTAVAYPAGRLGARVRQAEANLPRGLADLRNHLDLLLGDLALSMRTADPRQACDRGASRLQELAQMLSRLHADAYLIEETLRAGN